LKDNSGIGVAVTLFLASGGLGFLFSVLHHELHGFNRWSVVDHRDLLRRLGTAELLRVETQNGAHFAAADLAAMSRADAWVITTAVWRERLLDKGPIKAADSGATALLDLVHSAGAARVGGLCSLVGACASAGWVVSRGGDGFPEWWRWLAAVVLGGLIVVVHHRNYRRVGDRGQRFVEEVLTDALRKEKGAAPDGRTPSIATTVARRADRLVPTCCHGARLIRSVEGVEKVRASR